MPAVRIKTKINSRGGLTIPKAIRNAFRLKRGTRFKVSVDKSGRRVVLTHIGKRALRLTVEPATA